MTSTMQLRPIGSADTVFVAQLLDHMDPEDAELAMQAMGGDEASVFSLAERNGRAVGFAGVTPIDETASSAWLSYSAFLPQLDRHDIAEILSMVADQSREAGLTRLIAMEADAVDGERAQQHERFLSGLRDADYETATHLPDFYEPGEGALYLVNKLDKAPASDVPAEQTGFAFTEVFEHEESDGAYVIQWVYEEQPPATSDLRDRVAWARDEEEARMLVCSFPSTLAGIGPMLAEMGFRNVGRLDGFYQPGVHEVQYLLRWN